MASAVFDTEPDWPGIRAAAVAVGIREAARQASSHLPTDEQQRFVERAMKRCSREGWLTAAAEAKMARKPIGLPLSANVRTGADAVAESLAEDERETRISLSKSARKLAKDSESAELNQAGDVLQAAKTAALVHKWDNQQQSRTGIVVNMAILSSQPDCPVLDISSEAVSSPEQD